MTKINVGIAGCLGRMGQELIKATVNNNLINFIGGFEHPQHKNINKRISDLININTAHIVSDSPKKIFSMSDVIIDFSIPQGTLELMKRIKKQKNCLCVGLDINSETLGTTDLVELKAHTFFANCA